MSRDPKTGLLLKPVHPPCSDPNLIKGVALMNATDDPDRKARILSKLFEYLDED